MRIPYQLHISVQEKSLAEVAWILFVRMATKVHSVMCAQKDTLNNFISAGNAQQRSG